MTVEATTSTAAVLPQRPFELVNNPIVIPVERVANAAQHRWEQSKVARVVALMISSPSPFLAAAVTDDSPSTTDVSDGYTDQ